MEWLAGLVGLVLGGQACIFAWNWLYWHRHARLPRSVAGERTLSPLSTRLAVLIPARNERENLPKLLEALAPQVVPTVSVWVCDDESDDGTAEWLAEHAERYGVCWFRSAPRPKGWVGKNWACHQLAQHAQDADWLLFLDADVEPAPNFLPVMGALLARSGDAMLVSGIPTLKAATVGVGLLKVMMPFSIFTLLPLRFAERVPNPAFAFANGQVLAMRAEDYHRLRPHEAVRAHVLEDVAIARLVKQHGGQVKLLDLTPYLYATMYRTLSEAIDGFSKNAVAICRRVGMALFIALMLILVYGYPLGTLALSNGQSAWAWGAVGLSAGLYGLSARLVGLPGWYSLLYPLGAGLGVYTLLRSVLWYQRGRVRWKGRSYSVR